MTARRELIELGNRDKLIDATRMTIGAKGFAELTVSEISRKAGISAGFVHYYFGGKEGLLAATMQSLAQSMRSRILQELRGCARPATRLKALVRANFEPDIYTVENCRMWVEFWGRTHLIPAFARIERIDMARTRSNFRHALRQLVPNQDAIAIADELIAMLVGLWVRRSQDDQNAAPELALKLAMDHLERRLRSSPKRKQGV